MEVSDERLALLGSAYKRLFMLQNSFHSKAREYLKKAAEYYHKADEEQKRRKGDGGCYAILNALWLDMLLGESRREVLLGEAAPLSATALEQQAHAPADVWLWVQVADILCIRCVISEVVVVVVVVVCATQLRPTTGHDIPALWKAIEYLVVKSLVCVCDRPELSSRGKGTKARPMNTDNCFEL